MYRIRDWVECPPPLSRDNISAISLPPPAHPHAPARLITPYTPIRDCNGGHSYRGQKSHPHLSLTKEEKPDIMVQMVRDDKGFTSS